SPIPSHTTEFCFGTTGRFEIISIGEIAGPSEIVARCKVRKVIKLCEIVRQTTQTQFENNFGGGSGLIRNKIVTYPEPIDVLGKEYASDLAGYIEIKPRDEGYFKDITATEEVSNKPSPVFSATWGKKQEPLANSIYADSTSPYAVALSPTVKVGPLTKFGDPPYNERGDLFVDGLNSSVIRHDSERYLEYRAGVKSESPPSGPSNDPPNGNIHYYKAGLEFWFKPMFDATDDVIWGFCGITQVKDPRRPTCWTKGSQMFLFKNTEGVLRGTRLYFERAFDINGNLMPTLNKEPVSDPINYTPSPNAVFDPDKSIKYARTDAYVPTAVRDWKSNEWKHILVLWDDQREAGASAIFDIYVDGVKVSSSISFGEKDGAFVTLNEKDPHDVMYVGGFKRVQAYRAGVFKYGGIIEESCNGTIDGFKTFDSQQNAVVNSNEKPRRFYLIGEYENRVPVIFPGNLTETRIGNVSWTTYLPSDYHGVDKSRFQKGGVTVSIQVGDQPSITLVNSEEISNLIVKRGEVVKYMVIFDAVTVDGRAVCSPVFDDITITYVLPVAEVIESEEIFD
ncbi:MAG: hypothetical protein ABIH42_08140, partial [Planctomycetota bacterium]